MSSSVPVVDPKEGSWSPAADDDGKRGGCQLGDTAQLTSSVEKLPYVVSYEHLGGANKL